MIAVIFGGHGFIGSHLARALVASGRYSQVVSADVAEKPRIHTPGVTYIFCDVRDPIPNDLVPGVTEIYNLAAVHTTPGHDDWEYYWTNVCGALNVTDFARSAGVETLFFSSSISVYGPTEVLTTERSRLAPESSYGKSKYLAERIHLQWQRESSEQKLVIVRPAVIFGYKEHGNFTRLAKMLERRLFVYPGRKDTLKACGYVADLINSFEFARQSNEQLLVYNFAFDDPLTTERICAAFHDVANYPRPRILIPLRLILFVGLLFEMLAKIGLETHINRPRLMKLFRSTNIIPEKLQSGGFERSFDLEGALKDWRSYSSLGRFE